MVGAKHAAPPQITLPTEQQWKRAAQGDDGREYPWGNEFDKTKCNTNASEIGLTTPVTQYPQGASPFGVMDMSGNVWEWCLTAWDSGKSGLDGSDWRCLRGGSWYVSVNHARASYRTRYSPGGRNDDDGFRVCVASPST